MASMKELKKAYFFSVLNFFPENTLCKVSKENFIWTRSGLHVEAIKNNYGYIFLPKEIEDFKVVFYPKSYSILEALYGA